MNDKTFTKVYERTYSPSADVLSAMLEQKRQHYAAKLAQQIVFRNEEEERIYQDLRDGFEIDIVTGDIVA